MSVMIQIRNVPDALHRQLKSRAALAGMSLSDFLLNEIRQVAARPTLDELRTRLHKRPAVTPSVAPAQAVRAERDGSMIVIDPSAVLAALLRTPAASAVENWLFDPAQTLHAPHPLDVEVAQVLRRYAANGEIDADRGRAALADLADLPLHRYPHDFLLPRIWDLRHNLTAYDAVYVALAEALDAPLLTRDKSLATAPGHQARVELV